jgi:hypothetical protein
MALLDLVNYEGRLPRDDSSLGLYSLYMCFGVLYIVSFGEVYNSRVEILLGDCLI